MKIINNKLSRIIVIIFAIASVINTYAQEFVQDNYRTFYNFSMLKQDDNTRSLKVRYVLQHAEDKTVEHPVYKAQIKFINKLDDQEVILAEVLTSKNGIATLTLPENQKYLKDKEGNITLIARFEETEKLEAQEEEIMFKDIFLDFNLAEIDSVKTITLNAYTLNNKGEQLLVEETDVAFYIGGMLSKMKINDGTLESGSYEFEYEHNLPGDENGLLTFYAQIEDHEEFGNVTKMKTMNWGVEHSVPKKVKNSLWSKNAPGWMYAVLAFLLILVWANYVYVVISLFKLKKSIKKDLYKGPIQGN
ncbi:MAG: hypothetical protein KGZ87_05830 [Bacteroidetes bacterium]|jgi:5-hydroxyisourate hydrolase-like protein (transthyretin family)|nr:hypothetical protein [Bacteroidota bacterium]